MSSSIQFGKGQIPQFYSEYDAGSVCIYWGGIIQQAKSCTGKITANSGGHLGCGILVGIDRFLAPLHCVSEKNSFELNVSFSVENSNRCFRYECKVWGIHKISDEFVILQLSKDEHNNYPGNIISFPSLSQEIHQGEFLFSTHSDDMPQTVINDGSSCKEIGSFIKFCSNITTKPGDCGGGYFDTNGALFGIHISRSSGLCTLAEGVRQAIYAKDIVSSSSIAQHLFSVDVCTPICPPLCFSPPISSSINLDPCFIEEGPPKKIPPYVYRWVDKEQFKMSKKDGIRIDPHQKAGSIPTLITPLKGAALASGAKRHYDYLLKISTSNLTHYDPISSKGGHWQYNITSDISADAIRGGFGQWTK
ncbi:MAG: hypothetical protein KDK96_08980 [Chlamydiia bacterium]|nr:hypothetical protein [Simkania sp.]MCB1073216.1 hypothetical protein [Chlamydiia bacterium]